ncbi:ComEC/Rec2 family competence protein [Lyticum sinuosum]|uniref:ComEC/Rec2 family competence protein n=1 Tax=Lyticum sinuosum TaxID=1332059 RepID=A0AAE4VLH4_9RICK|nr:ComEC/Rec2 family competence protein [Lyticum sinuosum]MDZ5761452.1 ComEC/Rec2 family competence protein [Lyticum sinuosum]
MLICSLIFILIYRSEKLIFSFKNIIFFNYKLNKIIIIISLILIGYLSSYIRNIVVYLPKVEFSSISTTIIGEVQKIERREKDYRLYIKHVISKDINEEIYQIRINTKSEDRKEFRIGDFIISRVRLISPPSPIYPGSFDIKKFYFFNKICAIGYTTGKIRVIKKDYAIEIAKKWNKKLYISENKNFYEKFLKKSEYIINKIREVISLKVKSSIDQPYSSIVNAMIIGETTEIPLNAIKILRGAGTAHIVAISGLHVISVAGIIFLAIKNINKRFSYIALKYGVERFAAAISIVGIFLYMIIAGSPVSAQRAVGTSTILFLSIILGRNFHPVRAIAIIACIIILITPENLFSPGFQMSFSASLSLIITFRFLKKNNKNIKKFSINNQSMHINILYKIFYQIRDLIISSAVAAIATGPFIAYHFQQISLYSIIANLICVPVTNIIVMPLGIISLILMPLKLHSISLTPMSWGIFLILKVSEIVNSLPGSVIYISQISDEFIIISSVSFYIICMSKGEFLKKISFFLYLLNLFYILFINHNTIPDIVISGNGKIYAINNSLICESKIENFNGLLISSKQIEKYTSKTWIQLIGKNNFTEKSLQSLKMKECNNIFCNICHSNKKIGKITLKKYEIEKKKDKKNIFRDIENTRSDNLSDRKILTLYTIDNKNDYNQFKISELDLQKYGTHAFFLKFIKSNCDSYILFNKYNNIQNINQKNLNYKKEFCVNIKDDANNKEDILSILITIKTSLKNMY